jgi:hypothetical protein
MEHRVAVLGMLLLHTQQVVREHFAQMFLLRPQVLSVVQLQITQTVEPAAAEQLLPEVQAQAAQAVPDTHLQSLKLQQFTEAAVVAEHGAATQHL